MDTYITYPAKDSKCESRSAHESAHHTPIQDAQKEVDSSPALLPQALQNPNKNQIRSKFSKELLLQEMSNDLNQMQKEAKKF